MRPSRPGCRTTESAADVQQRPCGLSRLRHDMGSSRPLRCRCAAPGKTGWRAGAPPASRQAKAGDEAGHGSGLVGEWTLSNAPEPLVENPSVAPFCGGVETCRAAAISGRQHGGGLCHRLSAVFASPVAQPSRQAARPAGPPMNRIVMGLPAIACPSPGDTATGVQRPSEPSASSRKASFLSGGPTRRDQVTRGLPMIEPRASSENRTVTASPVDPSGGWKQADKAGPRSRSAATSLASPGPADAIARKKLPQQRLRGTASRLPSTPRSDRLRPASLTEKGRDESKSRRNR